MHWGAFSSFWGAGLMVLCLVFVLVFEVLRVGVWLLMVVPLLFWVCCIAWAWFLVAYWGDLTTELRYGCIIFCSLFFAVAVLATVKAVVMPG